MIDWTFALCDSEGLAQDDADLATAKTLKWTRNGFPVVTWQVDPLDDTASVLTDLLRNGLPRLRAWRRLDDAAGELWFHGLWAPMKEDAAADSDGGQQDQVQAEFRGPFDQLASRWTGRDAGQDTTLAPVRTFTQVDAGLIAWTLISEAGADSPVWMNQGTIEPTKLRDRTYESVAVADAVVNLTKLSDGGFDFEVTPADDPASPKRMGHFNVMARQGTDRSGTVAFEFGKGTAGNALSISRETQRPVNRVRVLGDEGAYAESEDLTSIDKWGLFMVTVQANDGTVESATLQDQADELIRPNPVEVVTMKPDPEGDYQPGRDYWLGDTIGVLADHGSLQIDTAIRVNSIQIGVSDENVEIDHALEFEGQEAS